MRITLCYAIVIVLTAQLLFAKRADGQQLNNVKISVKIQHKSLKEALQNIEKESGFLFAYQPELLDVYGMVDLEFKKANVEQVLIELLKNTDLQFKQQNNYILILHKEPVPKDNKPIAIMQQHRISGQVSDDEGPLVGASISIQGRTNKSVLTDAKGNFALDVLPGDKAFTVRYLGYVTQEFRINLDKENSTYQIRLKPDAQVLDDVIVTGYQTINKNNFTGTAITVTGEELKRMNPQNVLQSIMVFDPSFKLVENNLLGSNPNILPNINVRGTTAIPSGSEGVLRRDNLAGNVNLPAFILDGYEVSLEKIYDLDINRIATITLLKDAAATAVYGSRAANGVLVVTTIGPQEGKLQVYYNYETNLSAPDLSAYNVLNAAEKLEYERLAGVYENELLSPDQNQDLYYRKKYNVVSGVNTYWLKQPVETAVGHKHSVYLQGGSSTIRYGVDLRYQTMPGVMRESTRDRYGIGMDLSYNFKQKLLFKNVLTVNHVKAQESPYGSFATYVRMNPYYPMTDSLGRYAQQIDSWRFRNAAGVVDDEGVLNPLYDATLSSFNESSYLEIINAFSTDWQMGKGFRLRGLASVNRRSTDNDQFISPLSNQYFNYSPNRYNERGRYNYGSVGETALDGNVTLNYNRQISDHFLNFALGVNARTYLSDAKSFSAIGFSNDRFTNIGFANKYEENSSPEGDLSRERLFGTFLSMNYSLKNRYLMDVSVRADGSSKFGSENRIAPFWAVGLGWNIHEEDFIKSSASWISQLRLRGSTGLTGAVSFPPYLASTTYSYYTSNWYSTGVGAIVNQFGNQNLKWQRTRNYDVGMDIGFLRDRIIVSPRYYYKLTKDLLTDITLPPSTGFSSYKENLGDMKNEGFEVNLKGNVIRNTNWGVSLFANMVHNSNKLVRISNALKKMNDRTDEAQGSAPKDGDPDLRSVPLMRYAEGQTMNAIYAVRSAGIDPENGKELFIKQDGTLTYDWDVKDIAVVGDGTPLGEGFFGGSLSFKRFLLNVTFYTRFGGDQYNQSLVDRVENADRRYNVDRRVLADRWKQPGDIAKYKDIRDQSITMVTDRFVQRDNVLELQSLYLSYDFNQELFKGIGLRTLRAAVTVNNLWRTSTIAIERGIDYPFARNFNFSLQASF